VLALAIRHTGRRLIQRVSIAGWGRTAGADSGGRGSSHG
jgi:hypothetical protein